MHKVISIIPNFSIKCIPNLNGCIHFLIDLAHTDLLHESEGIRGTIFVICHPI